MKIFDFDPAEYREAYERDGWVHIPGGATDEFVSAVREFVERTNRERKVEGAAIGGRMDQLLFEFPDSVDFPGELFDAVAAMCGLDRSRLLISERHLKAYDDDAPVEPTPHKDRFASQVSLGISVDIPAGSELVLYPFDQVGVNPFNFSGALLENLPPDEHPDVALEDAREVTIVDSPGDVMAFPGRAVWHKRRRSAGSQNLYLKFNDYGCDPLGEDPATEPLREATVAALQGSDQELDRLVPVAARRLDNLTRRELRDGWSELIDAHVWGRGHVSLSEWDVELLRALDGERDVASVLGGLGGSNGGGLSRVRQLAEREVIDLASAPLPRVNGAG